MTYRAIDLEQNDVFDICAVLNHQAALFDERAAEASVNSPERAPINREKALALRGLTARLLFAWDGGKRSRVGSAA